VPEAAYGYDPAGNVISDAQRSFTYNAFNLPAMVTGAEGAEQAISYVGGTAFSRTNQDGEIRYYLDGLEVFKDKPASYSFAEGRLAFRDGEAHFQYRIADHLGNTVVLFEDENDDGLITDNPNDPEASEVLQRKLYYPFGMELRGTSPVRPVVAQRYAYNGKELVEGIGLYDYGARWYDPVVGRWTSVDPLAGMYSAWSPYNYVLGNPILHTDPDGRSVDGEYYNSNGALIFDDGVDDDKVYLTTQAAVDDASSFELNESTTGHIIRGSNDTYDLGAKNDFGLIQLTGMGNPNILNNSNTEDSYSYTDSNGNRVSSGQHGDDWVSPSTGAAFMDAVNSMAADWGGAIEVIVNDGSAYNPSYNLGHASSGGHSNGSAVDFRFLTILSGGSNNLNGLSSPNQYMTESFVQKLSSRGFGKHYTDKGTIKGTTHASGHADHVHSEQ
jgi:RHS repeat-associated protein